MEISRHCFLVLSLAWHNNICDIIICTTCIYFAEESQIKFQNLSLKFKLAQAIRFSVANFDIKNVFF